MFKKGDKVEQVLPAPITGTVAGFDVDQETGDVLVRIEWTAEDGGSHARHFHPEQLKAAVPAGE